MKRGYVKLYAIEAVLLVLALLNVFVFKIANPYVISGVLLAFLIVSFILLGFEKDNFRYKKDVLLNIIITLLIYYFITYFLGLFTGFLKSSYSLKFINILKNVFPMFLVIVVSELLRYILISKSKESKVAIALGYVPFVLIDVCLMIGTYDITTALGATKMICLVVFPSITKNILLTYVTSKTGYKNCMIYRIITELSTYVLPIFPDFGEYINVVLETVLPIIIVVRINNLYNYYATRKITSSRYTKKTLIIYSIITVALFVIVTLTSGYFRYYALTIGSGSMSPKIDKGDVVIVKRLKDSEIYDIKVGDVLVYNYDDRIIVHRVTKIIEVDGGLNFKTKGDNNDTVDSWQVKQDDVIGVVKFKIKYIGMPTVALNELLNG